LITKIGFQLPMGTASGDKFVKKTIDAVCRMNISDVDKQFIFEGGARRIPRLDVDKVPR